jgi:hypothetical protein
VLQFAVSQETAVSEESTRPTRRVASSRGQPRPPAASTSTCTSSCPSASASTSTAPSSTARPRHARHVKFVGRRIRHEWVVDEESGATEWYCGIVQDVVEGRDGDMKTVYDILYNKDRTSFEVDHLYEDWTNGSVEFVDI